MKHSSVSLIVTIVAMILVLPAAALAQRIPPTYLIVEKQTQPDGSLETFQFTGDIAGTIGDGETLQIDTYNSNVYTSTETVPAGWVLASIVCDDPNATGDVSTATATFIVSTAAVTYTCVFTNWQIIFNDGFEDGQGSEWAWTIPMKANRPRDLARP